MCTVHAYSNIILQSVSIPIVINQGYELPLK